MKIVRAVPNDTKEIFRIMTLAGSLLEHKDWYCIDTEDYVRAHIEDESRGIVYKAVEGGRIAAFLMIHIPGLSGDNLGHYVNLDRAGLLKVAYIDSVAVLPEFRGQNLMHDLMVLGEHSLASTPFCHLMGTVHPDNIYSLGHFLRLGFKVAATAKKYGAMPRNIMYKLL